MESLELTKKREGKCPPFFFLCLLVDISFDSAQHDNSIHSPEPDDKITLAQPCLMNCASIIILTLSDTTMLPASVMALQLSLKSLRFTVPSASNPALVWP